MKIDFQYAGIPQDVFGTYQSKVTAALEKLKAGKDGFTGWMELPETYDKKELERIRFTAGQG